MKALIQSISFPLGISLLFLLNVSPIFAENRRTISAGVGAGGGGFSMTAGPALIAAGNDLAMKIRAARPEAFANMPLGWTTGNWTPERLAQTVSHVCQEENETRSRPDSTGNSRRLIFDYCDGTSENSANCRVDRCRNDFGQYISALGRYFDINESGAMPQAELELRLLHEASHLFGLRSDVDARAFAERFLGSIQPPVPAVLPEILPGTCSSSIPTGMVCVELKVRMLTSSRPNFNRPFTMDLNFDRRWDASEGVLPEVTQQGVYTVARVHALLDARKVEETAYFVYFSSPATARYWFNVIVNERNTMSDSEETGEDHSNYWIYAYLTR